MARGTFARVGDEVISLSGIGGGMHSRLISHDHLGEGDRRFQGGDQSDVGRLIVPGSSGALIAAARRR